MDVAANLVGVWYVRAAVAGVAHPILVPVCLLRVRNAVAVVLIVRHAWDFKEFDKNTTRSRGLSSASPDGSILLRGEIFSSSPPCLAEARCGKRELFERKQTSADDQAFGAPSKRSNGNSLL